MPTFEDALMTLSEELRKEMTEKDREIYNLMYEIGARDQLRKMWDDLKAQEVD